MAFTKRQIRLLSPFLYKDPSPSPWANALSWTAATLLMSGTVYVFAGLSLQARALQRSTSPIAASLVPVAVAPRAVSPEKEKLSFLDLGLSNEEVE